MEYIYIYVLYNIKTFNTESIFHQLYLLVVCLIFFFDIKIIKVYFDFLTSQCLNILILQLINNDMHYSNYSKVIYHTKLFV